jgi:hypothetical protein
LDSCGNVKSCVPILVILEAGIDTDAFSRD